MTNYELLRLIIETLSRDIPHYRTLNVSVVDGAILQISHADIALAQSRDHASLQVVVTNHR